MSLQIGQAIGDYEVIGIVGAGGMGSVYKVRNLISDRVDAMKVLLPDLVESSELAERFLNEIKVLASLRHPNIAALHTALRVGNQLLMVMELVDGTNLDERLRNGPIPFTQAVFFISQVLSALSYAHGRGVVHRDIKPANIAIDPEGTVKLLDFGIARGAAHLHMTRTGMVLGSLFYMSPEQVNGQPADARSDLYSVGITLYRLVTGRRPIDGENEFAVMRAQTRDMPPPPNQLDSAIPRELSDAIMRALAKSPGDRFQTADQFRMALQPYCPDRSTKHASAVTLTIQSPIPAAVTVKTPLPSSSRFHSGALTELQNNLAQWLGPIAGALVRKHSRTAATLPELCQSLAEHIPAETERREFLKACGQNSGQTAAPQPAWDPQSLDRARRNLAGYIGPLAKIVVDRAAKQARNLDELYSALSAEIPSSKDRERFLAARSHLLD